MSVHAISEETSNKSCELVLPFEEYIALLNSLYTDFKQILQYSVIDKDDVFSIFRAVYVDSEKKFNPELGTKFTTYLYRACKNRLMDETFKHSRGLSLCRRRMSKTESEYEDGAIALTDTLSFSKLVYDSDIADLNIGESSCTLLDMCHLDVSHIDIEYFLTTKLSKIESIIVTKKSEGFTQKEIAKILGVSQAYITRKMQVVQKKACNFFEVGEE